MALLEIKNLVKNYGDVEALKGINLSIEKAKVVVILGSDRVVVKVLFYAA